MQSAIRAKSKGNRVDNICFNLILIDIFFLPLFPLFSVSLSLPVIIYWYIFRGRSTRFERERKYFSIVVLLMIFSTCFSLIGFEGSSYNTTFVTSVKRFFQYLFSFGYFFFFLYYFSRYNKSISNIVFYGIICVTIYALIYYFNQDTFIQLKQVLCPFDPQVVRWNNKELPVYRFNFLWADSNNVGYATTSLTLFYLVEEKKAILKKYIAIVCLMFVLLCTMSLGSIAVALVLMSYIFLFTKTLRNSIKSITIGLIALLAIGIFVVYNFDFFYDLINIGILKRAEIYGDEGIDGGGGRMADFQRGLSRLNPLFICVGSGQEGFVTEIGHIYLICMYGLPVYIYFMYILFAKKTNQTLLEYLAIVPIFVGFTVNIAIGEQKFLLIALLISAFYAARIYNKENVLKTA